MSQTVRTLALASALVIGAALSSAPAAEREQVRTVINLIAGVKMPFPQDLRSNQSRTERVLLDMIPLETLVIDGSVIPRGMPLSMSFLPSDDPIEHSEMVALFDRWMDNDDGLLGLDVATAAEIGGFRYVFTHDDEQLVFSAARELLANVVQHARASHVLVRLAGTNGEVELVVQDDGRGFPPERLAEQLADGHVGLASQRVRIEAAGGTMDVASAPDGGTRVAIRLPRGR